MKIFGHEAFTLFTAACYYKPTEKENEKIDASGLVVHSVVIVSNETIHERNIAFSCNMKLLDYLKAIKPRLKTVYFWSDACASQFRLKYVFRSLSFYPSWLKVFWDYGQAHHFKGPHDSIGGTIKRKVYQHVSSGKVIITDAKQFATYANEIRTVKVKYIDKSEIVFLNLGDAIYIHGTLKIHHVERINKTNLDFYLNSPYKCEAVKHRSITFQSNKSSSMAKQSSSS